MTFANRIYEAGLRLGYIQPAQDAEIARLRAMLARCLKVADSGSWRDSANLSVGAHPVWDDVRETLADGG
jgi:hypothetical protein